MFNLTFKFLHSCQGGRQARQHKRSDSIKRFVCDLFLAELPHMEILYDMGITSVCGGLEN